MGQSNMEAKILPLDSNYFLQEKTNSDQQNKYKGLKQKFAQLRIIQQLQKSIVKQNMHNAMSPLSAISGYLELIDMSLNENADVDQIEYYRKKIESGIKEVNTIIGQLQQVYNDDLGHMPEGDELLVVDLNWMVRDVCNEMHFEDSNVELKTTLKPLHTATDLYITKLILFKMISYASKCSSQEEVLQLQTKACDNMATFSVKFRVSDKKKEEIKEVIECTHITDSCESIMNNSLNEGLFASTRLIKQVGGAINFEVVDESFGMLQLSLPLS